jgi:hypothetical protein
VLQRNIDNTGVIYHQYEYVVFKAAFAFLEYTIAASKRKIERPQKTSQAATVLPKLC